MEKYEYFIDGSFLVENIYGVQRFAYEIVKRLDVLVKPHKIAILTPEYYDDRYLFKNLDVIKYGKHKGRLWTQLDYPHYVRKYKVPGIFLTNLIPIIYPHGIVVIHDLIFKVHPEYFNKNLRGKISVLWRNFNNKRAVKSNMKLVTVSNFSREEIVKAFHIPINDIDVVYNSWEQMNGIEEDQNIFNAYPQLKKHHYYFSLSSIAPNKNFQWILKAAAKYPHETFVIAGSGNLQKLSIQLGLSDLNNVVYLGYISDEEVKALMHYCKAFLFPTLYEGFGITPLEAVANGAPSIIVSDIPVMHEIYGETASYIDPYKVDLNIKKSDCPTKSLLDKFSWDESAEKFYKILNQLR